MVEESLADVLFAEYKKVQPIYEHFSLECEKLIESLLETAEISSRCHSVTHRSKGCFRSG